MKKFSLVLVLALASLGTILAQRTVSGTITDTNGEPLIGASVLVKGTTTGAVSDIDGNFSVSVPEGANTLVVSYTGFTPQEIELGVSDVVDVTLTESASQLSEVVVTGYSQIAREKSVASIATVGEDALENVPMPDVNQMIQGQATGVYSTAASGQPGAAQNIRIRGTGSISGNRAPLYVIDGVIVQSGDLTQAAQTNDILSNINPNDIESVNVLKDATATALYGSRGSNGVIVITTKKGRAGKTQITAKGQYGQTRPLFGNLEMMDAETVLEYERTLLRNAGLDETAVLANRPDELLDETTDWLDAAFRTGTTANAELQASGGNDKTRFYVSGGYFEQDGTLIESDFSRISLRANIDHFASDKLDFGLNVNGSLTNNKNAVAGNRFASPLLGAFVNTPLASAFNPEGELYRGPEPGFLAVFPDNFLYSSPINYVRNRNFRLLTKARAGYNITKNLRVSQVLNVDWITIQEKIFQDPTTNDGENSGGSITDTYSENNSLTSQTRLGYNNTFGSDHELDVFGVFEYQRNYRRSFFANGIGIADGRLQTLNSTANPQSVGGSNTGNAFVSFLASGSYTFASKYFVTANFRRDGSSRFGANNRWANFWSVGAGWTVSNEAFLQNAEFISNLKLKASYGTSGNTPSANFGALGLYGFGVAYDGIPGSAPSQIENADLTWEISTNLNAGVEVGFFNDRLGGSVEYYTRTATDNLLNVPVSRTTGFSSYTANIGEIQNRGWEIAAFATPFQAARQRGFSWTINANISMNRNEVLALPDGEDIPNGSQIISEGFPIRTFFLRDWAGVDPANGDPLWYTYDDEGNQTGTTNSLGAAQRIKTGNAEPQLIMGINNRISFAGFTLSAFLYTAQGHQILNSTRRFIESDGQRYGWNHIASAADNFWTQPGDEAERPLPIAGGNKNSNGTSTRYLEDASFWRLRNVTLGYTFPKEWMDNINLGGIYIYVQGQNLWTATDYTGYDPEALESGAEFFRYPVGASVTAGLDITF